MTNQLPKLSMTQTFCLKLITTVQTGHRFPLGTSSDGLSGLPIITAFCRLSWNLKPGLGDPPSHVLCAFTTQDSEASSKS